MDVGEYLCGSFDVPVIGRNIGELPHGKAQGNIYFLLRLLADRLGILAVPEIRIRISETRYRIADVAVWRDSNIGNRIPVVPPFLVVEVLSPEDLMIRVQPKIVESLSSGVAGIWVVDPFEKNALIFSQSNPAGVLTELLRTESPAIEIPLAKALDFDS